VGGKITARLASMNLNQGSILCLGCTLSNDITEHARDGLGVTKVCISKSG
jgi:hypothetical protein